MPLKPPFIAQAVVFDLDGVLVDSEDLWGQAEERLVRSYGRPWDPSVRRHLLGRGPAQVAQVLAEHLGLVGREDEVGERLLQYVLEEFSQLEAKQGVAPLVEALAQRVPLAVATNSRRRLAEVALERSGLAHCFKAVVSADDVTEAKPAPDPYATACRLLGAEPGRCVGIEDSPTGAASAKAAGLWVIGCPSEPGTELDEADVVVAELDELDAAVLLGG